MAFTARHFSTPKTPAQTTRRTALDLNVGETERILSVAAGAGIIAYGLTRRSLGGLLVALLGGALIQRGASGHCLLYEQLGIDSTREGGPAGVPGNRGINVVKTIVVNCPREEVYRYWRNLENLPRFMEHVESVRELDEKHSSWVVRGPGGTDLEWTARIITDRSGELIAWESLPGADVQNAGSVWFQSVGSGVTEVKVSLQYQPPAGVLGATVARLFGESPEQQMQEDLRRFKSLIEAQVQAPTQGGSRA